MTTVRRAAASLFCLAGIASGLAACGGQPAVCDDVDALRTSVNDLKNVQIGENALSTISTDLKNIDAQLAQLNKDASDQYSSEIDGVKKQADALKQSIQTATTNPSATSFTEVTTDVKLLGSAFKTLSDAMSGTCE